MSFVVESNSATDASPRGTGDAARSCLWCRGPLGSDPRALYCNRRCRQSAFRARQLVAVETSPVMVQPGVFAYADPPYPGLSSKYYRNEPTYAGEVDHEKLIASLEYSRYAGWALSCSRASK